MSVQQEIEQELQARFAPSHLQVVNESHQHNVPPNSETHFKLVLVSDAFQGQMPVRRHQAVYQALAEEMKGPVHALALHLFTPEEWRAQGGDVADSPDCRGGDGQAKGWCTADPEHGPNNAIPWLSFPMVSSIGGTLPRRQPQRRSNMECAPHRKLG